MNNRLTRGAVTLGLLACSVAAHAANDYALYLPFDGNLTDSSPNHNNGVATGTCTYTAGESGQALTFDGTSCFVEFKSVINNQPSWTWQAWVFPTASGGEIYGEGSPGVTFQIVSGGNSTLELESWNVNYPGEWIGFNIPGVLPPNVWTLVTLTIDGAGTGTGTIKVYINRSYVTEGAFQMESSSNSIYAGVGDEPGDHGANQPPDYFGGMLEELQIFQRALAPSEICAYPNILCGTNCLPSTACCTSADCPGPATGTGSGMCSGAGGSCSIVCDEGEVLCDGACIGPNECCGGVCPPSSCIQNPICDSSGHCTGDPVPDGTACELSGCPDVAACVSGACTCQSADGGLSVLSTADGGSKPDVKHAHGCAFASAAEHGDRGLCLFLLLAAAFVLAARRRSVRAPRSIV